MTLGRKIVGGATLAAGLTLIVGSVGFWAVRQTSRRNEALVHGTMRKTVLLAEISRGYEGMVARESEVLLESILQNRTRMEQSHRDLEETAKIAEQNLGNIKELLVTEEGRRLHDQLAANVAAVKEADASMWQKASGQDSQAAMDYFRQKMQPTVVAGAKIAKQLLDSQQKLADQEADESLAETARGLWTIGLLVLAALGIVLAVIRVTYLALAELRGMVGQMDQASGQVASAANQIASASQALARGASSQAASLEETSASGEEISSMARRNTENTHGAASTMAKSADGFDRAGRLLDELVAAMGEIKGSSDKISKIIKVIDEIAFQTNILALNAAVEAARAGEAGMGFAVVADEVRNLAQRCAAAAKDTSDLIEESILKAGEGKSRTDSVAQAIRSITGEMAQAKTLVDEVNLSSQEQTRGIEQVGKAIVDMEKETQRTAASAEECASASEELSAQSAAMKEIVGKLRHLMEESQVER